LDPASQPGNGSGGDADHHRRRSPLLFRLSPFSAWRKQQRQWGPRAADFLSLPALSAATAAECSLDAIIVTCKLKISHRLSFSCIDLDISMPILSLRVDIILIGCFYFYLSNFREQMV
ncbi:hypothetical protein LINGRAHAP2_LOCUS9320, partial [Linum grandiflorum]